MVVPLGALPTGSRVTLREFDADAVPPAPEGFRLAQTVYEIRADHPLQGKVTVRLPLPVVEADDIFLLARHAGKQWEAVSFDVKDGLAVVETETLSLWTFLGGQVALTSVVSQWVRPYLSVNRYVTAFREATGLDRYVNMPLEATSPEVEVDNSQAGGLIAVSARVIDGQVRLRVRNLVKFYLHLYFEGPADVQPVRGAYVDWASAIDVSNLIASYLVPNPGLLGSAPSAPLRGAVADLFKEVLPKDTLLLPEGTAEFVTDYLPGKNLTVSASFSGAAGALTSLDPLLGLVPFTDMEVVTAVRDIQGANSKYAVALPGLELGWGRRAVDLLDVAAAARRAGILAGEQVIKALVAKLVVPHAIDLAETVEGRLNDLNAMGRRAVQGAAVIVRYLESRPSAQPPVPTASPRPARPEPGDADEPAKATAPGPPIVRFRDPNLEAAVREFLGRPRGDITSENMAELTYLDASERGISSLAGLEHAVNLEILWFSGNKVSNIDALANLTALWVLGFDDNGVSDITPLGRLTRLKRLYFNGNRVSDITPLVKLTRLEDLWFGSNEVSDISALANLTSLEVLNFSHNQVKNISSLANLTGLRKLYAHNNQVSDIGALAGLTRLVYLNLANNQITDISPLVANSNAGGLGSGAVVSIQGNRLDLSPGSAAMAHIETLSNRGVYVNR